MKCTSGKKFKTEISDGISEHIPNVALTLPGFGLGFGINTKNILILAMDKMKT